MADPAEKAPLTEPSRHLEPDAIPPVRAREPLFFSFFSFSDPKESHHAHEEIVTTGSLSHARGNLSRIAHHAYMDFFSQRLSHHVCVGALFFRDALRHARGIFHHIFTPTPRLPQSQIQTCQILYRGPRPVPPRSQRDQRHFITVAR